MTLETILPDLRNYQNQNKKIVLVTGVFDIIHSEHLVFLHNAKKSGEILVVGLESDVRVKEIKGSSRPINSQANRLERLKQISDVDLAFILPENFSRPSDHENLIARIKPAILAVSSHTKHLDKKQLILAKYGGEVKIVHQHNPRISTTLVLQHYHHD